MALMCSKFLRYLGSSMIFISVVPGTFQLDPVSGFNQQFLLHGTIGQQIVQKSYSKEVVVTDYSYPLAVSASLLLFGFVAIVVVLEGWFKRWFALKSDVSADFR